jgi:hypothetical protein
VVGRLIGAESKELVMETSLEDSSGLRRLRPAKSVRHTTGSGTGTGTITGTG